MQSVLISPSWEFLNCALKGIDSSPFLTMLFLHSHGMHPLEQARKPPYVPVCFEASLTQLNIFQGGKNVSTYPRNRCVSELGQRLS